MGVAFVAALAGVIALGGCSFSHGFVSGGGSADAASDDGNVRADSAIDASGFSVASCPSSYAVQLSSQVSRYRVITSNAVFWTHHATCNGDLPGATHVAVLDTPQEAAALKAYLMMPGPQPTNARYFVGAVQDPNASTVDAGWVAFTGGPVATGLWGSFTAIPQPDDGGDGSEDNHDEQLAVLDLAATYMLDVRGTNGYGVVCECDGKAIDPVAAGYILDDPNHP